MLSSEKLTERSDLMIFNNPTKMNQQVQALEGLRDTLKLKGEILQVETDIARLNSYYDEDDYTLSLSEEKVAVLQKCIRSVHETITELVNDMATTTTIMQATGFVTGALAGKLIDIENHEGWSTFLSLWVGGISANLIASLVGPVDQQTFNQYEGLFTKYSVKRGDIDKAFISDDIITCDLKDWTLEELTGASGNEDAIQVKMAVKDFALNVDFLLKNKILTKEELAPIGYREMHESGVFKLNGIIFLLSSLANGVHGYKRHSGSIGYGLLWFLFGGGSVGTGLALQQGFGKPIN